MTTTTLIFTFAAGFLIVAGFNLLLVDFSEERRKHLHDRLAEELRLRQAERARNSLPTTDPFAIASEVLGGIDKATPYQRWKNHLSQTGRQFHPILTLAASPVLGLALGGGVHYLSGSLILGLLLMVVASAIPFVVVNVLREQRRKALLRQLPDVYEMLARVLRAGQTMSQAMRGIADEFSPPVSEEFAFCWEQQNLGLSPEASFQELAKRTSIIEIKIFVVAMSIHRSTGGNLSQLLIKLSNVIRERERIQGKVDALTAEGKFQAYLLIGLPFVLAGVIAIINPGYMLPLFKYPIVFVIAAGLLTVGYFWMQKIINFDQ